MASIPIILWCTLALALLLGANSPWRGLCISAAGAALLCAGAIAAVPDLHAYAQFVIFGLLTAIGLWLYTLVSEDARRSNALNERSQRSEALVGRTVTLLGTVDGSPDGQQRVQISDQFWPVNCPGLLRAGDLVIVDAVDDGVLTLRPASDSSLSSLGATAA